MMHILTLALAVLLDVIPMGDAFLRQLQKRDSVLVADQLSYGFVLKDVKPGTSLAMMDFGEICNDKLLLVRDWHVDTVSTPKQLKKGILDIEASVVLAPFEEGEYHLPPIHVARIQNGHIDTLEFSPCVMDVKTMPVDTASFQIHPLKEQLTYPVTAQEILPYSVGAIVLVGLIVLAVLFLPALLRRKKTAVEKQDPPHIVALRELDRWRSDKFWAPDKQKAFYSGITDALKTYIDARFGIDAPEMTTAELFDALKACDALTPELFNSLRELFERADFVKFAKHVADDKENAEALPLAVRFVTSTYQNDIEEEQKNVL